MESHSDKELKKKLEEEKEIPSDEYVEEELNDQVKDEKNKRDTKDTSSVRNYLKRSRT